QPADHVPIGEQREQCRYVALTQKSQCKPRGSDLDPSPDHDQVPLFTLPQLLSSRAFTPVFAGYGPEPAIETEAVDRRRRGERADAVETAPGPFETAFLQHAARGGIAHPRPADEHVVAEIA